MGSEGGSSAQVDTRCIMTGWTQGACGLDYTGAERDKWLVYDSLLDSDISIVIRLQRSYS